MNGDERTSNIGQMKVRQKLNGRWIKQQDGERQGVGQ
jgi:hypothetical protein